MAQFIQGLLPGKSVQGGQADLHALLPAPQHGFIQLLLLGLDELLCRQLILDQIQILRFPQDGRQQTLLCADDAQGLAAACCVGHLDLVHLTRLQHGLFLFITALAAYPFYGRFQLGHDGGLGDVGFLGQTSGVHLLLRGAGALSQQVHRLLDILQPLGILRKVILTAQSSQTEVQRIAHAVQQCLEALGAILFDVLIRVLGTGDLQHAHLDRAVAEQLQRPQGGFLARLVRVVTQDDFVRVLADEPHLIRGQGCAAGTHCCVDAGLLHADDVHIALAQHEPPGRTALGDLQREYRVRLVVDQRFRAVDVFGLGVIQHAAAKGNDVSPQIKNGGHHPLPEQAVDPPGRTALEQTTGVQLLLIVALVAQKLIQGLPVVGGIAQPEPDDGLVVQAAPSPVGTGLPGLLHSGVEAGMEKPCRLLVHGQDAAAHPAGLVVLLRLRHPGPGRQHLDGLRVVDAVDLFGKGNGIAAGPAAKAVKALGVRVDVKGGRFFTVEGAQPAVQPPLALELHIAAHQLHDVGAAGQFLNVFVWDHGFSNDLSGL